MRYWRSACRFVGDLVLGDGLAIEFQAAHQVADEHLKGLRALKAVGLIDPFIAVSLDPADRRTSDGIEILPWESFFDRLWSPQVI